jgi:hypothetical protein
LSTTKGNRQVRSESRCFWRSCQFASGGEKNDRAKNRASSGSRGPCALLHVGVDEMIWRARCFRNRVFSRYHSVFEVVDASESYSLSPHSSLLALGKLALKLVPSPPYPHVHRGAEASAVPSAAAESMCQLSNVIHCQVNSTCKSIISRASRRRSDHGYRGRDSTIAPVGPVRMPVPG